MGPLGGRRAVAAHQAGPALRHRRARARGPMVEREHRGADSLEGTRMELKLEQVGKQVGASTHLYPLDLTLVPRAVTVLLGATQAGKTSLMRLMAGLDKPTQGRVLADGTDVTGVPVRERNVAMVYQQFINYPSMSVAENIASPLRLRGKLDRAAIGQRVRQIAERLHIDRFLQRLPSELSGGQQQ